MMQYTDCRVCSLQSVGAKSKLMAQCAGGVGGGCCNVLSVQCVWTYRNGHLGSCVGSRKGAFFLAQKWLTKGAN